MLPAALWFSSQQIAVAQQQIESSTITERLDENSERLGDGSYAAFYEFKGYVGATVDIELVSEDFDAYLILIGPDGSKIGENDNLERSNARIVSKLTEQGTYTIVATTRTVDESGDYMLRWQTPSADALASFSLLEEAILLNQQVLELLEGGQYDSAIPIAQRALAIRESVLGADHADVAQSLNNLARLYQRQGNYAEALRGLPKNRIPAKLRNRPTKE